MSKRQQSAQGNNFNILYNIVYLINKSSGYNYVDFRLTINIDYFAQSDRLKVESLCMTLILVRLQFEVFENLQAMYMYTVCKQWSQNFITSYKSKGATYIL